MGATIVQANCSIEKSDCLDFLRSLPENSVDLIFSSPPYENCRLYLEDGRDLGIARNTDEWVAWMVEVFRAAQTACKGLVAFVVAGQTRNYKWSAGPALLMAELHKAGMNLRNPPIFSRVGIPGSGGPDWLRGDTEFIVCTSQPGKLPWSDNTAMGHQPKFAPGGAMSYRNEEGERKNARDKPETRAARRVTSGHRNGDTPNADTYNPPVKANPGNIIACKVGGGVMGNKLCHENEAPFPEALATFFVLSFAPPGGLVCDPFAGSGTTASVSVRHGRNFTGCDLRASQVALTERRLATVTPDLFVEVE